MPVTLLNREMYTLQEAARLLSMSPTTLMWWLDGGQRRGKTYPPVVRPEATGLRTVTWAEFVEAGLLRQYRNHDVPLGELRLFIEQLRKEFDAPYPLAHIHPLIGHGRKLVMQAQEATGLEPDLCLVAAVSHDQLVLTPPADAYLTRVDWEDDVAAGWRPHDDPKSPVRISPTVRYGRPAVGGISTRVLWEHLDGGEGFDEVARQFDLAVSDVRWAHAYETSVIDAPVSAVA